MEKSEKIINLTKAMLIFHGLVGKIKKDGNNPFFKANYATLSHILEEIQEPLQESGLVVTQWPEGSALITMLIHADSGEFFQSAYEMPVAKQNDPQAVGSAISYARRYAISSILSLNIDDDDANKASGKSVPKKESSTPPPTNGSAPKKDDDPRPWLNKGDANWNKVVTALKGSFTMPQVELKYRVSKANKELLLEEAAQ